MTGRSFYSRFLANLTKGVKYLAVINIAIALAVMILKRFAPLYVSHIYEYGALIPETALSHPWSLLTMMFLHDPNSILHVLMNMLGLASLGPWVERTIGTRRFITVYFISGVVGSLLYVLNGMFVVLGPSVGASGAVMGIVVAFALLFPNEPVRLWFVAPLKAKNLVWLALGLDMIFFLADTNIAIQVHLGGMIGAWAWFRHPWRPKYIRYLVDSLKYRFGGRR